ncbi:unnamed protein product [Aphanomyces euteiches]
MTHAVSWGPHGNQKVFACSEHHANEIMTNPSDFFIYNPENDTSVFCQGATTMYDGFESATHLTQSYCRPSKYERPHCRFGPKQYSQRPTWA